MRKERGVEFVLSNEELALTLVRFFRGLFLEVALEGTGANDRLERGKQLIVAVLTALICNVKGV